MTLISKRDKVEFKYRYRHEFIKLASVKTSVWFPKMKYSPVYKLVKLIAHRARVELGYSKNSADTDIVWHLSKISIE